MATSSSTSDSAWEGPEGGADEEDDHASYWAPLQNLADEVRGYVDSAHARWTMLVLVLQGGMWLTSILLTLAASHRASGMEARLQGHCLAPRQ